MQARDEMYRCLDFSTTKRYVSQFSVQADINYFRENIREVVLGKFNNRSALLNVVNQCFQLSIVTAQGYGIAKDILL